MFFSVPQLQAALHSVRYGSHLSYQRSEFQKLIYLVPYEKEIELTNVPLNCDGLLYHCDEGVMPFTQVHIWSMRPLQKRKQ